MSAAVPSCATRGNSQGRREDDRRLRNVLIPAWGERPVAGIRRADVRELP